LKLILHKEVEEEEMEEEVKEEEAGAKGNEGN